MKAGIVLLSLIAVSLLTSCTAVVEKESILCLSIHGSNITKYNVGEKTGEYSETYCTQESLNPTGSDERGRIIAKATISEYRRTGSATVYELNGVQKCDCSDSVSLQHSNTSDLNCQFVKQKLSEYSKFNSCLS